MSDAVASPLLRTTRAGVWAATAVDERSSSAAILYIEVDVGVQSPAPRSPRTARHLNPALQSVLHHTQPLVEVQLERPHSVARKPGMPCHVLPLARRRADHAETGLLKGGTGPPGVHG